MHVFGEQCGVFSDQVKKRRGACGREGTAKGHQGGGAFEKQQRIGKLPQRGVKQDVPHADFRLFVNSKAAGYLVYY